MDKKVVLITGASRGIGREIALSFGRNGCFVVVNYIKNKKLAEEVVSEIKKIGGEAISFQCDVGNLKEVKNMAEDLVKRLTNIDVLVNNAGIINSKLILQMTENEWDDILRTNLTGVFNTTKIFGKVMARNKSGSIINISSIVGLKGNIGEANYASAKAGVIGFTKSSAMEFGRFGVCINCILPGYHLTDMGKENKSENIKRVYEESVLGKTTDIKELADFVVFLSKMKTVSGQVFNFDSRII